MGVSLGSRGDCNKEGATLKHLAFFQNRRNGLNIAIRSWEVGSLPLLWCFSNQFADSQCVPPHPGSNVPCPTILSSAASFTSLWPKRAETTTEIPQASSTKCTMWLSPTPLLRLPSCCQRLGHPRSSLSLTLHLCRPLVHVWALFLQGLSLFCIVSFSLSITVLLLKCTHSLSCGLINLLPLLSLLPHLHCLLGPLQLLCLHYLFLGTPPAKLSTKLQFSKATSSPSFQSLPLKNRSWCNSSTPSKTFTFLACFWTLPPPGFPPSPWMLLLRVLCWLQFFPHVTSPGFNFHPLLFSSKSCWVWLISWTPLTLNVICVDDSSQVSISWFLLACIN